MKEKTTYLLRLTKSLKTECSRLAKENDVSINQFICSALEENANSYALEIDTFPVNDKTQLIILEKLADSYPKPVDPKSLILILLASVRRHKFKADPLEFITANFSYLSEKKYVVHDNKGMALTAEGVDFWKVKLYNMIEASNSNKKVKNTFKDFIDNISDLSKLVSFVKNICSLIDLSK